MLRIPFFGLAACLLAAACAGSAPTADTSVVGADPTPHPTFVAHHIVDDADHWWALTHGDLDGDGLEDLVFISANQNASGYLAYRVADTANVRWREVVIAAKPTTGIGFAAGDLETGDIDGDGDIDVLAARHPGEWVDAAAPAELLWYANPGKSGGNWVPHPIGATKGAVKDYNLGDFNGDGLLDLAVMTFNEHNVRIHRQNADGMFTRVADLTLPGIHEGMDVGDLDGDGDLDVAANGYTFMNPGGDLTGAWTTASIDDRWHNQTVHKDEWSLNATKTFIADIDGDGTNEIFVSHSENGGYPVMYYTRQADGAWRGTTVLGSLASAHTLMVYDMDGDGDKDIVTGSNRGRAVNLEPAPEVFPLMVLLNQGDNRNFVADTLLTDGIYNGRVADYDGDGDMDIFRYPEHEATDLYVLINQSKR